MRKHFALISQKEGHPAKPLYTFDTYVRASRARDAAEMTLNEFATEKRWRVWIEPLTDEAERELRGRQ